MIALAGRRMHQYLLDEIELGKRAALALERSGATISPDGIYRYALTRRWDSTKGLVRWIMLNPSTADATVDDPTIRRCMGFARSWGFGGILVHNLFALRATDPRELKRHPDPVGPHNNAHLADPQASRLPTVCAWGAHGALNGRADAVLDLLRRAGAKPTCLGLTKAGHPRHPLYLPASAELSDLEN